MTTQTPDREKQRLIKEVQFRSEELRRAPKSTRERIKRELDASKKRLAKRNADSDEEVEE
jgi:hypothetical protein